MASQRSKKTQSSQSKSSSGARHGGSTSNSSSKRPSGSGRSNPDRSPSRSQPGRSQKSETRSSGASPSRASNGSRSRRQEPEGGMMNGMVERVTSGAKEAGTKAVDSVKQHPVSAAMIGAGVAGLGLLAAKLVKDWASSDEGVPDQAEDRAGSQDEGEESEQLQDPGPDEAEDQYDPQGSGGEEGEKDEQGGDEESGTGLMGRARDAWGAVRHGASSVGETVEHGYEYGRDKLGTIWEDHPLAVSAGLLALGVAAGMLIPASRAEKKIFGRTSGKLTDKVVKAGRELFDQGSELAGRVISEAGTAIREEAEREGLSPDKLARKVKRIAGRIKDVIGDAAGE